MDIEFSGDNVMMQTSLTIGAALSGKVCGSHSCVAVFGTQTHKAT